MKELQTGFYTAGIISIVKTRLGRVERALLVSPQDSLPRNVKTRLGRVERRKMEKALMRRLSRELKPD